MQDYLAEYNAADLFNQLLEVMNSDSLQRINGLKDLQKKAMQRKYKAVKLDEIVPVNWIISFTEYLLKKGS
jgi:hypothetical protein